MDKMVDYFKYTVAMALGLAVYLPANFLPASSDLETGILIVSVGLLGISIATGLLFYTRATTIIVNKETPAGDWWLGLWGSVHLWSLLVVLVVTLYFFGRYMVWEKTEDPGEDCTVSLPAAEGDPIVLSFPCKEVGASDEDG